MMELDYCVRTLGFSGDSIKNPSASAGDICSLPESGRSPWRGKWQPTPVIPAWEIPWTEEPDRL